MGHSLELVKDLGDAGKVVSGDYGLGSFNGDPRAWSYPDGHRVVTSTFARLTPTGPTPISDMSVVHNGQITNYWIGRSRQLERRGHRFLSNCDSEMLAVYTRRCKMNQRLWILKIRDDASSIEEIDGVFTYLVATSEPASAWPRTPWRPSRWCSTRATSFVALASEEVAIRSVFPHEIDTHDPYEGEVRVWTNK